MADTIMRKIIKQSLADMQSNIVESSGPHPTDLQYISELSDLIHACHEDSVRAGWWPRDITDSEYILLIATKFALIHSEVSEAFEAYRKDTMDMHIPDMKGVDVELADTAIRLFDLAGELEIDLISAIAHKRRYNAIRADHKLDVRNAPGGKRF